MSQNYLVISAIGPDTVGIVDQLTKIVSDSGCNIQESRMTVLGKEFAVILLLRGNWNTLAKLESSLPSVGERLSLEITTHRTECPSDIGQLLPYAVEVVAMDQPGIVHQLGHFFAERQISIRDMATNSYRTAYTGTEMFAIHMNVDIPGNLQLAALREEFMDFCDQMNLDAVIEPIKT